MKAITITGYLTRHVHHLVACVLMIAPLAVNSDANTASLPHTLFTAEYAGKFDGWKVDMQRTLKRTGAQSYTLESKASNLFASVKETSHFDVVNGRLQPKSYTYNRKVFGKKKTESLVFDWPNKRASYTRSDKKGSETQIALKDNMLDPSSYQLVLQADMYADAGELDYQFVKRKRVKNYQFMVLGAEDYTLDKQEYKAELVRRETDDRSKRTTVWLLPAFDYQLAKIEHVDDGDTYELLLKSYEGDAAGMKAFLSTIASNKREQALTYKQVESS